MRNQRFHNALGRENLNADEDGFLDLSCLDKLRRGAGDNFLMPQRIFVRSHIMQAMFSDLLTKAIPQENKRVLTGSAGIDKSVLFFLVSLRFQLLPEN